MKVLTLQPFLYNASQCASARSEGLLCYRVYQLKNCREDVKALGFKGVVTPYGADFLCASCLGSVRCLPFLTAGKKCQWLMRNTVAFCACNLIMSLQQSTAWKLRCCRFSKKRLFILCAPHAACPVRQAIVSRRLTNDNVQQQRGMARGTCRQYRAFLYIALGEVM